MNQDRFWELVSLKMAGEASGEELTELEQLLRENPGEGSKLEMMNMIWASRQAAIQVNKKESFNKHLQRLSNHFSEPVLQYEQAVVPDETETGSSANPGSGRIRRMIWAAGIAASLLVAFFLLNRGEREREVQPVNAQNTVSTKKGSKSKVELPDGTQVWLNADSRITYNENFRGAVREVQLSGEAFFDVVRDETRPFIIHANAIDLKVLGTAFNVRSYADEKNTETSLIHGSVEITLVKSPDKRKIILKPSDKLIVNILDGAADLAGKNSKKREPVLMLGKVNYKKADSSVVETLWVKNKLAFDDEPLEEIARKIERWYDVKVMITNERLKKESYTATFEDKTLKEVMEALQEGGGFDYSINKREVMIHLP